MLDLKEFANSDDGLDIIEGLVNLCIAREKEIIELSDELNRIKRESAILEERLLQKHGHEKRPNKNQPTLMIADTANIMRKNLANLFIEEGYDVVAEAGTGQEVLSLYNSKKPDLITLDIEMPDIDGFDLIHRIKKLDSGARIIIVSRVLSKGELLKVIKAGVLDVISKPVMPVRLLRTISQNLRP
ncbi:MAG TPA: response regulator [bacterium]|jgi:two-component system chemotaxis response regulator CheY